ncbi:MAG: hypothetical protein F6J87_18005 [Spirulina sp. SIO3F2]|nr:hypothetical protein [Spirulina sp. SIO3F2]
MMSQWLGYLLIAAIPGMINLIAASQELGKQCRALVFFQPLRSPGVYFWVVLQLLAPSILFWYMFELDPTKSLTLESLPELLSEAFLLGVGFVAILNSTTEVGSIPIKIKPIYSFFVEIAYDQIAKQQTRHTAYFWRQVEVDLETYPAEQIVAGLAYLEDYFIVDISLDEEETESYRGKLEKARQNEESKAQIKLIKDLLKDVRRADLAIALQEFGFPPERVKALLKPRT